MNKYVLAGVIFLFQAASPATEKIQPLNTKLGLWEVTVTMSHSGQPPIPADVLARLTPQQRAMMEERMKANTGGDSKPIVRKNCVTKEKMENGSNFVADDKQMCTRKVITSTSSKLEMQFSCAMQGMKNDTTLQVEVV